VPESAVQEIVCCIGQPVAGNPTQFMLQRAFAAAGLDWYCLTLEVAPEDLEDTVRGIRAMGFRGANLTIPHKVSVTRHLDALSEAADLMGAVNCIYRVDNQLIGENTDGKAFLQSLREVTDPHGKRIVLLGAGGAARAIAVELGLAQAEHILVANRSAERGQQLVDLLNSRVAVNATFMPWSGSLAIPDDTDILINATSIGVLDSDARIPIDFDTVKPAIVVADVVFNPPQTWFLFQASRRGCTTLNGLGMLVNQAAIDFRIWTELEPNTATMREAVEEYLEV
jgi:shikimate dehydrogenase